MVRSVKVSKVVLVLALVLGTYFMAHEDVSANAPAEHSMDYLLDNPATYAEHSMDYTVDNPATYADRSMDYTVDNPATYAANYPAAYPLNGCQCTDFVYNLRSDIPSGMGHARDWLYSARVNRFPYDRIPQVGDVVVILNGQFGFSYLFGHVAIVVDVDETREHFSFAGWDGFKANCQVEIYTNFPVTYNTYFIHRKDARDMSVITNESWLRLLQAQLKSEDGDTTICGGIGDVAIPQEWCSEDLVPQHSLQLSQVESPTTELSLDPLTMRRIPRFRYEGN
jgi:surface antigen